jgi:hypothetical protein
MSAEHTTMAMRSIFTHTYICNIVKIRELSSGLSQCFLNNSVFIICATAHFIFMIWNTEKHDAADSCFLQTFQFIWKTINAVAVLSFHGWNFFLNTCTFLYKKRIDQR